MLTDRLGLPDRCPGCSPIGGERWDGEGHPRSSQGRADPAPGAHRPRGPGRRVPAHARRSRSSPLAWSASGREAPSTRPSRIGSRRTRERSSRSTMRRPPGRRCSTASRPPQLRLQGEAIERALAAMGDFADLASPYLVGHSRGVAELAGGRGPDSAGSAPPTRRRPSAGPSSTTWVGSSVPVRVWNKAGPLTPDDWERVRLHAYHSERVLTRSPFLAALAPAAAFHHERLDGSGYHRGASRRGPRPTGPSDRRRRRLPRHDRATAAPARPLARRGRRDPR